MYWRFLRALEHLLTGALISLAVAALNVLGHPPGWRNAVVRWWHRRLCRILALQLEVSGTPREHALLVSNHISWLDIPVLGAQGHIVFLSKADVRRWPVIGWMAAVAGTLFIERGANRFAEVIAAVRASADSGVSVVVFAEGTTTDGAQVLRFLPRLFAVVQPCGTEIAKHPGAYAPTRRLQPIALRYGSGSQPHAIAPFIGDDTLVRHLWRVLKHPGIPVQLCFLPCIPTEGQDRRALAASTRGAIQSALGLDLQPPPSASDPAISSAGMQSQCLLPHD